MKVIYDKRPPKIMLLWLSGGASSAYACYLALCEYKDLTAFLVRIDPLGELEDNTRFCKDFAAFLKLPLHIISCKDYGKYTDCNDHLDVLRKIGCIRLPGTGAPCTTALKKDVRKAFVKELCDKYEITDEEILHVWGFDADEKERYNRIFSIRGHHTAPLFEHGYRKEDAIRFLLSNNIQPPRAYYHGMPNANCVGCVKGGGGYWNVIRRAFPEVFEKAAKLEREIGFSILRKYYLDELPHDYGRNRPVIIPDCGALGEFCRPFKGDV